MRFIPVVARRARIRSRVRALVVAMVVGLAVLVAAGPASAGPAATQACAAPVSGPGIQAVVQQFTFSPNCGGSTILRQGSTDWGLTHIEIGGGTGNVETHETTDYAKYLWQLALNSSPVRVSGGFYTMAKYYETPAGIGRVMCVYVDTNNRDGYGQRGIITAFWIATFFTGDCISES